jgi:hypothetical protein
MKKLPSLLFLFIAALASAGDVKPPTADPLARLWEVEQAAPGLQMMTIDLGHGDPSDPDFLSVYLSFDTQAQRVADIVFVVPGKADKAKGLAIGFVEVGKAVSVPPEAGRVLTLGEPEDDEYTVRVARDVIPATETAEELDLLACLLKYQLVTFNYWSDGKEARASTTLSGFQSQYRDLLKKPAPKTE